MQRLNRFPRRPGAPVAAAAVLALLVTAGPALAAGPCGPVSLDCPSAATPADREPGSCFPYPQPFPAPSSPPGTTCDDGVCRSEIVTGDGIFPACNPFDHGTFPGNNFLPNVYENLRDIDGNEMANTLPSTPAVPYNLHGDPEVTLINPTSPTDDLETLLRNVRTAAAEILRRKGIAETRFDHEEIEFLERQVPEVLRVGLDILEGHPVPNRAYSGFPLLHYVSPEKVAEPRLTKDADGRIVKATFDVRQIWYDQHIESDVAYIDVSDLGDCNPLDDESPCEWTITYTVDVLNRGHDDFSPFAMFFDRDMRQGGAKPHAGMDQSFFDMEEGTRTVFEIRMPPAKYLNLIYTWGWRMHPPRIQSTENALKKISYTAPDGSTVPHLGCPEEYDGLHLPQVEQAVFCRPEAGASSLPTCDQVRCAPGEPRWDDSGKPTECEQDALYAIGRLGELAPAKRMWMAFGKALDQAKAGDWRGVLDTVGTENPTTGATAAFFAWKDRTKLPCYAWNEARECTDGVEPDPDSDLTILYANNTIYGQLVQVFDGYTDPETGRPDPEIIRAGWVRWDAWKLRPQTLKVTAMNADHFVHSYVNVDFGGNRGWENQFKSSVKVAGSGCWFTFGRAAWWINAGTNTSGGWLCVPVASDDGTPGRHLIDLTYNYEPSRRLRFYQFDQFHHDVAIYSLH
ncbi:MAG: hypothetical protein AAGN66_15730 [Acidobacteriota bacterium]